MLEIRNATEKDLDMLTELEHACFPADEAASREMLNDRLASYANHFWLLERDGELVSMVNGMVTDDHDLDDSMYADASQHNESGKWQMLFGVETLPKYRRKGYASILMKEVIKDCNEDSRKGIVLTCKEEYIPFYEKLGFVNKGRSISSHAGKTWYLMELELDSHE